MFIRTYYLDWARQPEAPALMYQRNAPDLAQRFWREQLYVPGPEEDVVPRTADHMAICEYLWDKYNQDTRPDGKFRRSMSVGDIVEIGRMHYLLGAFQFVPVEV